MPREPDVTWLCSALTIRRYFFDATKKKQNAVQKKCKNVSLFVAEVDAVSGLVKSGLSRG